MRQPCRPGPRGHGAVQLLLAAALLLAACCGALAQPSNSLLLDPPAGALGPMAAAAAASPAAAAAAAAAMVTYDAGIKTTGWWEARARLQHLQACCNGPLTCHLHAAYGWMGAS